MKILLAVVLFALSAFAQDQAAIASAEAACGPTRIQFEVSADKSQHSAPKPEPGKALVYIVEDERQDLPPCLGNCGDITKFGIDGRWIGANRGSSYFFFSIDPGEHHLCATWDKGGTRAQDRTSLLRFTAEPGDTYYFRVRVTAMAPPTGFYSIDLEPVNHDEGQLLVAASAFSTFHPKK